MRRAARRRLPRGVFDYIDGGAEDELTLAANEAAFAATTFRPRVLRGVTDVDVGSTLARPPARLSPGAGPHRLHPHRRPGRRAGRGPGRGPRRAPVHPVDPRHPLHRGGPGGERRTAVVPGLRLARPGAGGGHGPAGRGRRLRGARAHRRHRGARAARARRAPRLLAAAPGSGRRRSSTGCCPPGGRGRSCAANRSASPTWPARRGRRVVAGEPVRLHHRAVRPVPVVGRRRVAALDLGRPDPAQGSPTGRRRVTAADLGVDAVVLSNHGGRQLDGAPAPSAPRRPGGRRGRRPHRGDLRRRRAPRRATSSRPSLRGPGPAPSGAPTCTASAPEANAVSTTCCR
jgi:hypothetical protein